MGRMVCGGPHFFRTLLGEQMAVAVDELSAVQLQLHPLRHVSGARIDRACGAGVVQVSEGDHLQLAVNVRVREGVVVAGFEGLALLTFE